MTVSQKELPTGSNLIMGLNPPFGVRASLANKFIDKALSFRPKLLVLIVPPETERLDKKRDSYDLIWQDVEKLNGKSFYLPGSTDVENNKIAQWNVIPPVLYLWSRWDWTSHHRTIAIQKGHASESGVRSPINDKHMKAIKEQREKATKAIKEQREKATKAINFQGDMLGYSSGLPPNFPQP